MRPAWSTQWAQWKANAEAGRTDSVVGASDTRVHACVRALFRSTLRAAHDDDGWDWAYATDDRPAQAMQWVCWAQRLRGALRERTLGWAVELDTSGTALLDAASLVGPGTRQQLIRALHEHASGDSELRASLLLTAAVLDGDASGFIRGLDAFRGEVDEVPLTTVSDPALALLGLRHVRAWPRAERRALSAWLVPLLDTRNRAREAAALVADYLSADRPESWLEHADRLAPCLDRPTVERLLDVWKDYQPIFRAPRALQRLAQLGAGAQAMRLIGTFDEDSGRRHQQLVAMRGVLRGSAPPQSTTIAERMCTDEMTHTWEDVLAACSRPTIEVVLARTERRLSIGGRLRVLAALPDATFRATFTGVLDSITTPPAAAPLLALTRRANLLSEDQRGLLWERALAAASCETRLSLLGNEDHDGLASFAPLLAALGGPEAVSEVIDALHEVLSLR